jgi:hypothetical protein
LIELGDEVKHTITGFQGIAIARTKWLTGCDRITIQPRELREGKPIDSHSFDEPECAVIRKGVFAPGQPAEPPAKTESKPGGPRSEPKRREL